MSRNLVGRGRTTRRGEHPYLRDELEDSANQSCIPVSGHTSIALSRDEELRALILITVSAPKRSFEPADRTPVGQLSHWYPAVLPAVI